MQAGSSGRGRDFAARWAELIFTGDPEHRRRPGPLQGPEGADRRRRAAIPQSVKMLPDGLHGGRRVRGPRRGARAAVPAIDLVDPMASLTLLSELMNYDFSGHDLDEPDHRRAHRLGVGHPRPGAEPARPHRWRQVTAAATWPATGPPCCRARASWAPADAGRRPDGGVVQTGACDGFVLAATHLPGGLRGRRAAWWCPSCSAAGCSATDYTGTTLRDHLGLGCRSGRRSRSWRRSRNGRRCLRARSRTSGSSTPPRWSRAPWWPPYLGEFGADVIKVEQPGAGDPLRTWGDAKDGIGLVWKSVSRNKRCVTLDLRHGDGQAVLHELLDRADVLILGSRPSALARWGLDTGRRPGPPSRSHRAARLGLRSGRAVQRPPGFGTLAEAMSGFAHLAGEPDGPPTLPPFMLADGVAALAATLRRDDGPLPPRRPRRRRAADRRQPDRAAGAADRVGDAGLRPARESPPQRAATASTPARPATPTGPPTAAGWRFPPPRPGWPCGCSP